METVAFIAFPLVLALAMVVALKREDVRLRRQARRYRQLELEGIEELRRNDPYPEERAAQGGFLREPNGSRANADDVLREELRRAREHMSRKGKGAACLL
jgi:hypothetical protein